MSIAYTITFDGGCRRSEDCAAAAGVLWYNGDEIAYSSRFYTPWQTNNIAEYQGLILGLELAVDHGLDELEIVGDSELVIQQIKGVYAVRKPHLRPLHRRAVELGRTFKTARIYHAKRDFNVRADALCNLAMDLRVSTHHDQTAHRTKGAV